eukprot:6198049-Pleurochrysis_carterae.AAC.2
MACHGAVTACDSDKCANQGIAHTTQKRLAGVGQNEISRAMHLLRGIWLRRRGREAASRVPACRPSRSPPTASRADTQRKRRPSRRSEMPARGATSSLCRTTSAKEDHQSSSRYIRPGDPKTSCHALSASSQIVVLAPPFVCSQQSSTEASNCQCVGLRLSLPQGKSLPCAVVTVLLMICKL